MGTNGDSLSIIYHWSSTWMPEKELRWCVVPSNSSVEPPKAPMVPGPWGLWGLAWFWICCPAKLAKVPIKLSTVRIEIVSKSTGTRERVKRRWMHFHTWQCWGWFEINEMVTVELGSWNRFNTSENCYQSKWNDDNLHQFSWFLALNSVQFNENWALKRWNETDSYLHVVRYWLLVIWMWCGDSEMQLMNNGRFQLAFEAFRLRTAAIITTPTQFKVLILFCLYIDYRGGTCAIDWNISLCMASKIWKRSFGSITINQVAWHS